MLLPTIIARLVKALVFLAKVLGVDKAAYAEEITQQSVLEEEPAYVRYEINGLEINGLESSGTCRTLCSTHGCLRTRI